MHARKEPSAPPSFCVSGPDQRARSKGKDDALLPFSGRPDGTTDTATASQPGARMRCCRCWCYRASAATGSVVASWLYFSGQTIMLCSSSWMVSYYILQERKQNRISFSGQVRPIHRHQVLSLLVCRVPAGGTVQVEYYSVPLESVSVRETRFSRDKYLGTERVGAKKSNFHFLRNQIIWIH
jgi:hypothetical protein